jgi:5,10-methylenetetrahydromethanopterin reductase
MRVSLQLIPEQPAAELLAAAKAADELGYYACYTADEIYHKDAWVLLAAVAAETSRIRLGPCVVPVFLRDPTQVAQAAATLDDLSAGRAEVVLGIGNLAMLEQYGIEWRGTRPLARLREAHEIVRTLLDDGSIDFRGDFFRCEGVATAARPIQPHVPVKIGAMGGPKSVELAGEIADGLMAACAYSTEALGYLVDHVSRGARRAGRDPGELDIGDSLLGAIAPTREAALRAGRALAAFYIPSMPDGLLERHGIQPDDVREINEAFAAGDVKQALALTPDGLADRLVVAGSPEDWVDWLTSTYEPCGLDHALVSFADPFSLDAWVGVKVEGLPGLVEQVRLFGEEVLPRLSPAVSSDRAARTP